MASSLAKGLRVDRKPLASEDGHMEAAIYSGRIHDENGYPKTV